MCVVLCLLLFLLLTRLMYVWSFVHVLQELAAEFDANSDGLVSYQEFANRLQVRCPFRPPHEVNTPLPPRATPPHHSPLPPLPPFSFVFLFPLRMMRPVCVLATARTCAFCVTCFASCVLLCVLCVGMRSVCSACCAWVRGCVLCVGAWVRGCVGACCCWTPHHTTHQALEGMGTGAAVPTAAATATATATAASGAAVTLTTVMRQLMARDGVPQIEALRREFRLADGDGSGRLTRGEFRRALAGWGCPLSAAHTDVVFRELDTDGSGRVSFAEFVRGLEAARGRGGGVGGGGMVGGVGVGGGVGGGGGGGVDTGASGMASPRGVARAADADTALLKRVAFGARLGDMRRVFGELDGNGSGKVSRGELRRGLERLGLTLSDSEFNVRRARPLGGL